MEYKKIKASRLQKMSEDDLRELWRETYCTEPICTFDGVLVRFFTSHFNHAFYESDNRRERDKSVLSHNRLEKMLWIKDVLQDKTAILKQGWDRDNRTYNNSRRVTLIKGNYIVIIEFTGVLKAAFVTAYEVLNDENLGKILESPNWIPKKEYMGIEEEE